MAKTKTVFSQRMWTRISEMGREMSRMRPMEHDGRRNRYGRKGYGKSRRGLLDSDSALVAISEIEAQKSLGYIFRPKS